MFSHFLGIDIGVRVASKEAIAKKIAIHFSIRRPKSLLKAIERFFNVANKTRVARRLFHVNFFLQIPMGFNIHLMDLPFI